MHMKGQTGESPVLPVRCEKHLYSKTWRKIQPRVTGVLCVYMQEAQA